MSFEDRDYFRERPRLEFSGGIGSGTITLLIMVAAGYFIGAMLANTTSFLDPAWFSTVMLDNGDEKFAGARLFYSLVVLTDRNVAPWVQGFEAQPWKLLTSWLVEPTLLQMALTCLGAYFIGRIYDELVGARRLITFIVALSVMSALGAALLDPLLLGQRTSVIMGIDAALMGLIAPLIWLFPADQKILSFPAPRFITVLLGIFLAMALFTSLLSVQPLVPSPTQPLFAVAIAAGVTVMLKRQGRLARFAGGAEEDDRASWGKPMYQPEGEEPAPKRKLGKLFSMKRQAAEPAFSVSEELDDRKRIDALLEKISKNGLDSLSKIERKALDEHSRKMKK